MKRSTRGEYEDGTSNDESRPKRYNNDRMRPDRVSESPAAVTTSSKLKRFKCGTCAPFPIATFHHGDLVRVELKHSGGSCFALIPLNTREYLGLSPIGRTNV